MNTVPGIHPLGHAGHVKVFSRKTFHQNSSSLAINWDSFNVGVDERVQFLQPGASSIALNRILDNSGSRILGSIDANGQVIQYHRVRLDENQSIIKLFKRSGSMCV